jgi:hypothetical protein
LIRAAADHAAGHAVAPPPDLIKLWDWQDLSTPPVAGGLDDQDAGFLRRARYLEAVHDIMRRWYHGGSKDFTPSERDVFNLVLKIRKETNASQ